MSWPAKSKGVFNEKYSRGASPGPKAPDRDPGNKEQRGTPLDARGRVLYPAKNKLNKEGMRKPK